MNRDFPETYFESSRRKPKAKLKWKRPPNQGKKYLVSGFNCGNCHAYVSTISAYSGVNNRNHCPYCLFSKHLDLKTAGDRLAACKGIMEPVGLTLKRIRKKYGYENCGELMLIHRCLDCGRISINRLAGDDDPGRVIMVFTNSIRFQNQLLPGLEENGIRLLTITDTQAVHKQLFGRQSDPLELSRIKDLLMNHSN